jgi:hypothetical protein
VAQARAQQAGEIDGVHKRLNGPEFNLKQGLNRRRFDPYRA